MESSFISAQSSDTSLNEKPGKLVKKARKFVYALYKEKLPTHLHYHTFTRVNEVVQACKELATGLELNPVDREILLLSAWFVDTGFNSIYQESIHRSAVDNVQAFFVNYDYSPHHVKRIIECIKSVLDNCQPKSPLDEALHDGYWLYLAQKDLMGQIELLRSEREWHSGQLISDAEWIRQCLDDFAQHPFYSVYAQKKYGKQQAKNWLIVDRKLRRLILKSKQDEKSIQSMLLEYTSG